MKRTDLRIEERETPAQISSSSSLDSIAMNLTATTKVEERNEEVEENSMMSSVSEKTNSSTTNNIILTNPPLLLASAEIASSSSPAAIALNGSVPEFLFQLMKMLTDDNREVIEWSNGKKPSPTADNPDISHRRRSD